MKIDESVAGWTVYMSFIEQVLLSECLSDLWNASVTNQEARRVLPRGASTLRKDPEYCEKFLRVQEGGHRDD